MDYPWAERFGEIAREADVALSIHAPLFGFMGHLEASGRKLSSRRRWLDRQRRDREGVRAAVVVSPTPAFCSAAAARTRSRRWSSSGNSARSGSRGRIGPSRSGSRSWAAFATWGWARRCTRDLGAHGLGAAGARLRSHARDQRRRLPGTSLFAEALEAADAVLEPGAAVPRPLLRHRVRKPQRDEAPSLRRGNTSRRPAARRPRPVRAPRDSDLRVA